MSSENEIYSLNSLSTLAALPPEVLNYDSVQFERLTPGYLLGEFKNYRLLKRLGEGGMGQTWLAEELSGGEVVQKVVVKILSKELCGHEEALAEVRRVFDLTGKLRHSNICATLGMKKDPVFGWILVMDYADGGTLWDWFQRQPNHENGLPLAQILPILRPIAEALDFAHKKGILHRDVKPQNIMFSGKTPLLIDFGIAARIRPESVTQATHSLGRSATTHACSNSGTPVYMAPEQMMGRPQTGRADQYALAMVLYELLVGKHPFTSENLIALSLEKAAFIPENPNFPPWVSSALRQALAMLPENRFPTCGAFIDALSESSQGAQPISQPISQPMPAAPIQKVYSAEIIVPDDVPTFAEACQQIPAGGKITIRRGAYAVPETVTIKKDVTIYGNPSSPEKVVLFGGEDTVLRIHAGVAEIRGITFMNEGSRGDSDSAAVEFEAPAGILEKCVFSSQMRHGLSICARDSNPTVSACVAHTCGMSGFYVVDGAGGTFMDCESSGNAHAGICVEGSGTNPTVEKCRFKESKESCGIGVIEGAGGTFTDCEASGNALAGIQVEGRGTNPTVEKCRFIDGKAGGIVVMDGAGGTFTDCDSTGNSYSGIQVEGRGTNPTVEKCRFIDGKSYGIAVCDGAGSTFTDCEASGNAYAGIQVEGRGTNPTVEKCRFKESKESCGILVSDGAGGTFTDCESSGNAYAGIGVRSGASGTFTDCESCGNAWAGIGVEGRGTNPTVERCEFKDNSGIGILIRWGGRGMFTDCESSGNEGDGLVVIARGRPTVTGCRIMNNNGCGIGAFLGAGTFRNNTISGNDKPWHVGWFSRVIREGNNPNR